jgi:Holliday junction DNA helicase RuvB
VTLIDVPLLEKLFGLLEIDSVGLTDIDVQYLRAIATMFENQPVGVETLSSSLAEDKRTIEEFIEPYLLQIGFIRKTSRGRIVTSAGLAHLSIRSTVTSDEQDRLM